MSDRLDRFQLSYRSIFNWWWRMSESIPVGAFKALIGKDCRLHFWIWKYWFRTKRQNPCDLKWWLCFRLEWRSFSGSSSLISSSTISMYDEETCFLLRWEIEVSLEEVVSDAWKANEKNTKENKWKIIIEQGKNLPLQRNEMLRWLFTFEQRCE